MATYWWIYFCLVYKINNFAIQNILEYFCYVKKISFLGELLCCFWRPWNYRQFGETLHNRRVSLTIFSAFSPAVKIFLHPPLQKKKFLYVKLSANNKHMYKSVFINLFGKAIRWVSFFVNIYLYLALFREPICLIFQRCVFSSSIGRKQGKTIIQTMRIRNIDFFLV